MTYDDWKLTDPDDAEYCAHNAYQGCSECEGEEQEPSYREDEK